MKSVKNSVISLLLCVIAILAFSAPRSAEGQQLTFFKPLGGKVFQRWDTVCLGMDLAFDVVTPDGKKEGPFAITPLTDRNKWYTIIGVPGKNILLTVARFKLPLCIKPCDAECCTPAGVCPVYAYPVYTFGVSLIPTIGL